MQLDARRRRAGLQDRLDAGVPVDLAGDTGVLDMRLPSGRSPLDDDFDDASDRYAEPTREVAQRIRWRAVVVGAADVDGQTAHRADRRQVQSVVGHC